MRVSTIAAFAALISLGLSTPMPQDDPPETDLCLQRKFLSALLCRDIDPTYNNVTLPDLGWYCCWYQGPFAPPPAQPVSTAQLQTAASLVELVKLGCPTALHKRTTWRLTG
ncbi:hypothetical protein AAE478_005155 [Parahypoxylon ruwenzoriense]